MFTLERTPDQTSRWDAFEYHATSRTKTSVSLLDDFDDSAVYFEAIAPFEEFHEWSVPSTASFVGGVQHHAARRYFVIPHHRVNVAHETALESSDAHVQPLLLALTLRWILQQQRLPHLQPISRRLATPLAKFSRCICRDSRWHSRGILANGLPKVFLCRNGFLLGMDWCGRMVWQQRSVSCHSNSPSCSAGKRVLSAISCREFMLLFFRFVLMFWFLVFCVCNEEVLIAWRRRQI